MCTGDFGTNARHPPRERIDSPISNFLPREGVAALPYTESLTSTEHVIIASNGTFPVREDTVVRPYAETITKRHIQAESKPTHQAKRGVCWRPEAPAPNHSP